MTTGNIRQLAEDIVGYFVEQNFDYTCLSINNDLWAKLQVANDETYSQLNNNCYNDPDSYGQPVYHHTYKHRDEL